MAENKLLEIATDTMINLYNLDETEYAMFKFSEGAKNVQIGMTNGEVPLVATFPREFLAWREMEKWNDSKKEDYVRHHMMNGMDLPEVVAANWAHIIKIVEQNPRGNVMSEENLRDLEIEDGSLEMDDALIEEEADSELNTPIEATEPEPEEQELIGEEMLEQEKEEKPKTKKKVVKKKK